MIGLGNRRNDDRHHMMTIDAALVVVKHWATLRVSEIRLDSGVRELKQDMERPAGKSRRAVWSGRVDLNHRPHRPECCNRALASLPHEGRTDEFAVQSRDEAEVDALGAHGGALAVVGASPEALGVHRGYHAPNPNLSLRLSLGQEPQV